MHFPIRLVAALLIAFGGGGIAMGGAADTPAKADPAPAAQAADAAQERLIKLIDDVGYSTSRRFDPQKLIVAVNALQAAGPEQANAARDEYLRKPTTAANGLTVPLVARVLFDPNEADGAMPRLAVGAPNPAPTDLKQFPRFPLMLVDDVPFLVVRGYTLAGQAESGSADLANIRRTCLFRKVPLKPPTNLRKLAFDAISKAASLDDEQLTSDVANQVLRLTASVYEPRKRVDEGRILYHDFDAWWSAVKADLAPLKVSWDAESGKYTKQ